MKLIEESEIEALCRSFEAEGLERDFFVYHNKLMYHVLRLLFGQEWADQCVYPHKALQISKRTREAVNYFKSQDRKSYQSVHRLHMLANYCYDLQDVKNFGCVIKKIQDGGLAGAFAEVEVGHNLFSRNISFEYVRQSNSSRFDFDIRINDFGGINCEVKHKLESTRLSKGTVEDSLSRAKSQMPEDEPALIFMKLSTQWDRETTDELRRAVNSFFPRSPNVLGVVFATELRNRAVENIFHNSFKFIPNLDSDIVDKYIDVNNTLNDAVWKPYKLVEDIEKYTGLILPNRDELFEAWKLDHGLA
jgi:hypothetical protein